LRKTAKHDRRANLLYATDAGEAMLKAVTGKVARAQVRMVEKLSPRERKVFIKLMMRLVGVDEATDLSILNAAAE
jgi:MarR family transcriptional regulator, lower aerobic nicotinate degradation pathway regulator